MNARQTSVVTLSVLAVIVLFMAVFGVVAVTRDLPGDSLVESKPVCEPRKIAKGSKVRPGQVTVSVFNAGRRSGLASRTMEQFITRGFGAGDSGNAKTKKVTRVLVRSDAKNSPAAKLVAAQFGPDTPVVTPKKELAGPGINVVVGDDFDKLLKGAPKAVKVTEDTTICSPPIDE